MKQKKIICKIVMQICAVIFIFVVGLKYIEYNTSLKIVGDEFGYWSSAAFLANYDWTEVASYNSYYGYGYGIILLPILLLPISQTFKYQLAVCLNVLLVCITYIIIFTLINKKTDIKYEFKILLALGITLCSNNVYYIQYTMAEILLVTLFWGIAYLSIELLEGFSKIKLVTYILLLMYSFAVHQRMLGVVLVGMIYVLFLLIKNCSKLETIAFIIVIAIITYVVFSYKDFYQNLFLCSSTASMDANDFGGQVSKVLSLLSIDGIKKFIKGMIGKVFYAYTATFLLCGLYLYTWGKEFITAIKKRKINNKIIILSLLLCFVIVSMAIDTVFMLDYQNRFDLIIYGRYFELTLQPILLVVLLYLLKEVPKNVWVINIFVYQIMTLFVNHYIPYEQSKSHLFLSSHAVADVLINSSNTIINVCFWATLVYLLIYIFKNTFKKGIYFVAIILMVVSINKAFYVYENGCLSWAHQSILKEEDLATKLMEEYPDKEIYYYVPDNYIKIDYLQFLLGERTVNCISTKEEIDSLKSGDVLITTLDSSLISESKDSIVWESKNFSFIQRTDFVKLWVCQ